MSRASNILDFISEQDPETAPEHGLNTTKKGYNYQDREPKRGDWSHRKDTKTEKGDKPVGMQGADSGGTFKS